MLSLSRFHLQFDDGKAVLDKDITTENIQVFITGEQLPLVVEFNDEVCNHVNKTLRECNCECQYTGLVFYCHILLYIVFLLAKAEAFPTIHPIYTQNTELANTDSNC